MKLTSEATNRIVAGWSSFMDISCTLSEITLTSDETMLAIHKLKSIIDTGLTASLKINLFLLNALLRNERQLLCFLKNLIVEITLSVSG
jgi:hypothetical protein